MRSFRFARDVVMASLLGGLTVGGCGGGGGRAVRGSDYVLVPEEAHYGSSYSGWSARWWQWAIEIPNVDSPWQDHTGAKAGANQVDPVWFLVGTINASGLETRDITIPRGVALFFPLINIEWDDQICLPPGWVHHSISGIRDECDNVVKRYVDLYCEVDGDPVIDSPNFAGAVRWRAQSPAFSFRIVPGAWTADCPEAPGQTFVDPALSDGIWMMLAPMPPGLHTIHFGGTDPTPPLGGGPFVEDITYNITVAP